jgi:prepilin-type N-terminal cleavage/methylation domain-containing protein
MRAERGFTLIEVMVALIIAGLLMAAMFEAVTMALGAASHAARYEEAVSRCRSHLAALDPDIAKLAGVSQGDDGGGFHWHLDIRPMGNASPVPGMALYDVAATISWHDGGAERAVTLDTQRLGDADDRR